MTKYLVPIAAAALLVALALAAAPAAQFETPNRSFHNATGFRLDGKHQTVACEACHLNGQFKGTPSRCYDCHWIRRRDDRFQTRLGSACEQCHRPTSWTAVRWDHAAQAGVPLNADHRQIACEACHGGATFRPSSVACVSCHQKDYAATQAPNHAAAGFPVACDACHRPNDSTWRNTGSGRFNHNAVFTLSGAHATASCTACHRNNVYKGTPRDCVGCHLADYNRTQNPNHASAGFPTTCETCHRASDPAFGGGGAGGFSHNAIFALVGVHASQACAACHRNNVYKGTPRDCIGCHQADYSRTQSPNHAAAGFSTTCDSCHRPTDAAWSGAGGFNHNAVFALVGSHASQSCTACHANNVFRGTPRTCLGCHQAQYNATRNPPHAAAGFPTSCDSCHRPTDPQWTGASFNHASVFALVGVHASQACTTCHVNNVYRGTPRTCVGCHITQYNASRNPSHAAAGFPTTCETCHRATDSTWLQGTFNHTRFPLTSRHNVPCAQCHTTPNNFATFSCTVCHTRAETDGHHSAIRGYVYDSNACYSCHPNGRKP